MSTNNTYSYNDYSEKKSLHNYEVPFQTNLFSNDEIYLDISATNIDRISTGLSPIIKWPGGKEKELKYILPKVPHFKRYFEPFVGGGSVFMGINAREYYINDFSSELVELYKSIAKSDIVFFDYLSKIEESWKNCERFFNSNKILSEYFIRFRRNEIDKAELRKVLHDFCISNKDDILSMLCSEFTSFPCVLVEELEANLQRKMGRMRVLEIERNELSESDVYENILTAIKSAVYMNYRYLYNNEIITLNNPKLHCALFFFMRNYAYSGMFRYSSKGDFNVPYGGMAYNRKMLSNKIDYYHSKALLSHFARTKMYNLDFEDFLETTKPDSNDFVFLDPPYDSEFSTYAQKSFTRDDQKRLANYLINKCKAKWMMIIKNTDFIFNLYDDNNLNILSFEKEYVVSFMNRNDRKVEHLLITNY